MNMMMLKNILLFLGIDNENCELEVKRVIVPFNRIVCCDTPLYIKISDYKYEVRLSYELVFKYDFFIAVGR